MQKAIYALSFVFVVLLSTVYADTKIFNPTYPTTQEVQIITLKRDVNLRSCGSLKCKVMQVGLKGQEVKIWEKKGNWYTVSLVEGDTETLGYMNKIILY